MIHEWFYITIMPRGEVVQRFLRKHEAEAYAETFNRVMRHTEVRAEWGVEPCLHDKKEPTE